MSHRPAAGVAACLGGAAVLAHMLPSVLVLGQWTNARSAPQQRCIWRGGDHDRVALTFDDGPQPGATVKVLDRLDSLALKATFFCLGHNVTQFPDLTREIAARGHEVATHGHQHTSHFRRSPAGVGADLRRSIDAIVDAGLPPPRWFRPPYGHVTGATMLHANRNGLPVVLWSAMGKEWVEPTASAVAHHVVRSLSRGAIVLLHDPEINAGSNQRVTEALPHIATAVAKRGWSTMTLGELMSVS